MKKRSYEEVKNTFEERGCKLLSTEYTNRKDKLKYIATCGHYHEISLNNFLQGKGDLCKACRYKLIAGKESNTDQYMRSVFEDEGCKVITKCIQNSRQQVEYIAQCGHVNSISFSKFQQGGGRICRKCSKSIKYELSYVRELFEQRDCILLADSYKNCKTPMLYIAQCGHASYITLDVFLNCPNAALRCKNCHKHSYHDVVEERNMTAMKEWRKAVYEKDGYECVRCGRHGGKLNAHHIDSYDNYIEERLDVDNGATLCDSCHIAFHKEYGFGNNNREQFEKWLKVIPR